MFGVPDYCRINVGKVTFFQPDGFQIMNTLERNGVLSMGDPAGNSIDIYINKEYGNDIDKLILSTRDNHRESIVGEEKLYEDGHLFHIHNISPIDPFDTIILIQKNSFIIEAYLFKFGDPQTHGAFEDNALKILRSIEQGEITDDKRAESCINGLLLSY